jgi:hypothetical protein
LCFSCIETGTRGPSKTDIFFLLFFYSTPDFFTCVYNKNKQKSKLMLGWLVQSSTRTQLEVQKHPVQLQADETREAFLQSEDRDREREREREREVLPLALRDFSI